MAKERKRDLTKYLVILSVLAIAFAVFFPSMNARVREAREESISANTRLVCVAAQWSAREYLSDEGSTLKKGTYASDSEEPFIQSVLEKTAGVEGFFEITIDANGEVKTVDYTDFSLQKTLRWPDMKYVTTEKK